VGLALSALAPIQTQADVISLEGDKDCFGLGGSCPDGTLWRDDLGGVFFNNYSDPGDPAFTDKWSSDVAPAYSHAFALGGPATGGFLSVRIAGVADFRGPWDVFGDGFLLGQIPTNTGPNGFQEVITYSWVVPSSLLGDGLLNVLLNINSPTVTDGYSIDYSELTVTTDDTAVPEPASLLLLGSGLLGMWRMRRRG
jgi:hypothetical protein